MRSAFGTEGASHPGTLPKAASTYTTELYAVWQAFRFCENRAERKFDIFTDSVNFVTALDNTGTVNPLLQQIMAPCHAIDQLGLSFTCF